MRRERRHLSARSSSSDIGLTWTVANLSASSQEVYRDTDSNPSGRVRLAFVGANTRSFNDTGATPGVTYYYWIKNTTNGVVINSNAASGRR